ncbi:MAG: aminotransferase class V-fold PLP-dependent enzyme, partial [Chloroflexia bacterium]|nr:aminotransferase class V-fold PLP-dependent enzyme [Chloroflexia bacterium]
MREEFLLDPEVVFLNHGSFGATPEPVFAAYGRWQRELERQPVEFLGRRAEDLLDAARGAMASYLGCERDDLVFVPNATTAINVVARSLPLEPGEEVVGTDLEYGACEQTWEWFCAKRGARYVKAHIPLPVTSPEEVVAAIFGAVTPRTRAIFLSHVTSGSALRLPVEEVARRAREMGILSVVDGAHAVGQWPVDLEALGVDCYASNFHKWLCAPKGSGFLYAHRDQHDWLESPIVSWGWVDGNAHFRTESPFVSRNQMQGTRDIAAFLSAPAAVLYQEERDWETVRERCHVLASEARERIAALSGLPQISAVASAEGYRWFRQMAIAPLPERVDGAELKRRLYDEFRVEAPVTGWKEQPFLRVSFQGYNTRDDLEALMAALEQLLPQMTAL